MLNGKQRAYLRSLANTMETILIVGKSGMSDQIIKQAEDAILKRELIKGRVLETASMTSREAADEIARSIGAQVVQVIGSKFILYRKNPKEPVIKLPRT